MVVDQARKCSIVGIAVYFPSGGAAQAYFVGFVSVAWMAIHCWVRPYKFPEGMLSRGAHHGTIIIVIYTVDYQRVHGDSVTCLHDLIGRAQTTGSKLAASLRCSLQF